MHSLKQITGPPCIPQPNINYILTNLRHLEMQKVGLGMRTMCALSIRLSYTFTPSQNAPDIGHVLCIPSTDASKPTRPCGVMHIPNFLRTGMLYIPLSLLLLLLFSFLICRRSPSGSTLIRVDARCHCL